jgi:hypothetical protein
MSFGTSDFFVIQKRCSRRINLFKYFEFVFDMSENFIWLFEVKYLARYFFLLAI